MAAILRPAGTLLKGALAGGAQLASADLFTFTLADGLTVFRWTSWDRDLLSEGNTYSSRAPYLWRSKWNVTNTMEVPKLTVYLAALNDGFNGGANIKTQIHNGLFDGAGFVLSRAFMPTPGDTTTLGNVDGLFGGRVSDISLDGVKAEITVKGKNNILDQYFPRNRYQAGCNHAFCDAGCTLLRATFTQSFTVGSSPAPTPTFVPWSSAPGTPGLYVGGTLTIAGAQRNITNADATGLTLAYPLYATPSAGDSFTAFQGCDKTFNSGSGRSCTDRSNTQHYRGYEFIPPPTAAV